MKFKRLTALLLVFTFALQIAAAQAADLGLSKLDTNSGTIGKFILVPTPTPTPMPTIEGSTDRNFRKILTPSPTPTPSLRRMENVMPAVRSQNPEKYSTTLKIASSSKKPVLNNNGSTYASKDGVFINWKNQDLKWWFNWDSQLSNINSLVWQVSTAKFDYNKSSWKTPIGLIASGTLKNVEKEFSIDFGAFCDTQKKWSANYISDYSIPYMKNVLQLNKSKILNTKNKVAFNKIFNKSTELVKVKQASSFSVNSAGKINASVDNVKLNQLLKKLSTQMPVSKKKAYYIRVVPLDNRGNCIEMPVEQREVIYGEPNYGISSISGISNISGIANASSISNTPSLSNSSATPNASASSSLQLKCTDFGSKQNEVVRYGVLKDAYFNWNTKPLIFNFQSISPKNTQTGVLQVSSIPFETASDSWDNPSGLVYKMDLTNANPNQDSIVNLYLDFSLFAPKKNTEKDIDIPYYVRLLYVGDGQNGDADKSLIISNTVKVHYGSFKGSSTEVVMYAPVKVPIYSPIVSFKEYKPVKFEVPFWNFRYVVVKEPPGMLAGIYGHVGSKVDLSPRPEDKDWTDYVGDAIDAAVGFVGSLINWASQTMAKLEDFAANMIVSLVPGQPAWLKSLVLVGIQAGLTSLGIPPTLPNTDDLMNMGVDYIAATVAQQVGIPAELTSEIAKQGVKAMVAQSQSTGSMPGMDFLKLDPDYSYHNAYMTLDLFNPDSINSTMPGSITVTVRDVTPGNTINHWTYGGDAIYREVNMPIPSLKPKQHMQVPVIFEENNESMYTGPGSLDVQYAWLPYYNKGTSEFKIDYNFCRPDLNELSKQLGVNAGLIQLDEKYGNGFVFNHQPNKAR